MKIYHFVLLFIIFFLAAGIRTDINLGKMKEVQIEKKDIAESLYSATSDAINTVAASGRFGTNSINKDELLNTFFTSLYSSIGIVSKPDQQSEVNLYIPVILLCDTDGYYVNYFSEYTDENGTTSQERIWSEKMPYFYQDDYFLYHFTLTDTMGVYDQEHLLAKDQIEYTETNYHEFQTQEIYQSFRGNHRDWFVLDNELFHLTRKTIIMEQLEETLSYYTSRHNTIARQNGITYRFAFPAGQEEGWAKYLDDINMVVVFQGYPYGVDQNATFNKVASSGANVLKKEVYYVEKRSWYYLAHQAGCLKLENNDLVLEETFSDLEACAKIGAFCDDCIVNGPRVPELK